MPKAGTVRSRILPIPLTPGLLICIMVEEMTPSLVVMLLLAALGGSLLLRVGSHRPLVTVGALGQSLPFALAMAITVVLFGLAPAEVIPSSIQAWVFTILVFVLPPATASFFTIRWLKRRTFKFTLRALLVWMTVLGVLLGSLAIARSRLESFGKIPFELSIAPRDLWDLPEIVLPNTSGVHPRLLWAALQWSAYQGPYLTLVLWAAILGGVIDYQRRRTESNGSDRAVAPRDRLAAWSASVARGALALAALALIAYLICAPTALDEIEREYQVSMTSAGRPSNGERAIESAILNVESNPLLMEELKAEVRAEMDAERAAAGER
jgi:hypothetical protein